MTDGEAKLMQEHGAYWKGLAERGIYLVIGLVSDPKGAYGVGIVDVENEAEVRALTTNDPTMKSALGFTYEIYPMPRGVIRK